MATRRHPIHGLPFEAEIANDLEAEYREQPLGRRFQARRKAWARSAMLVLTGQARRHVEAFPAEARRLLWAYSWTTVGDAVLDLAPRRLIPARIELELLISPHLAPLFATDARFRRVHTDPAACGTGFDGLLLDSLRTRSLRMRAKHFGALPFATMREHQAGERFDRTGYADHRLRQLFGLAAGPVETPHLDLGADAPPPSTGAPFRIGLSLGARVARKLYPHWPEVIAAMSQGWPADRPAPEFVLLGQGKPAARQHDAIAGVPLVRGATLRSLVDAGSLRKTAIELAACDAFLGVDGGLMHVAVGVGTRGLALFTHVDPAWFLRPGSSMIALLAEGELETLAPATVAAAFIDALPGFSAAR